MDASGAFGKGRLIGADGAPSFEFLLQQLLRWYVERILPRSTRSSGNLTLDISAALGLFGVDHADFGHCAFDDGLFGRSCG